MVRKSLDYHSISRRGFPLVDAFGAPIATKPRSYNVIDGDTVTKVTPNHEELTYERDIDVAAVVTEEEDEKELHASLWTLWTISYTNMASDEDIKEEIKNLEGMVGTGYYDDEEGNLLMKQVIVYLQSKLAQG